MTPAPSPPPPPPVPALYVYACPDGFRFAALNSRNADSVTVSLPGSTVTLPHVASADGAKYEGPGVVFWNRGQQAMLESGGQTRTECQGQPVASPWEEARLLGIEFRAVGQEPGWTLDLDQGHSIRYTGDYGKVNVLLPAPLPTEDSTGTITYHAQSDAHELTLVIRNAPCSDAMSGVSFPQTVTVRVDGRDLHGCGQTLSTGDITDTYWKLLGIGGAQAASGPPRRQAHLRMTAADARVSGSTGCNTLTGSFKLTGDTIQFGPIATTRMACLDPAISRQEQDFLRALGAANRVAVQHDTLTLLTNDRPLARFSAVYLR